MQYAYSTISVFVHFLCLVVIANMDIVDRMFEEASKIFPDDKSFANEINVKPQRISEWRLRKSSSYVKRLEKISTALNVTPQYLLTGEGPKTKAPASEAEKISNAAAPEGSGITDEFARIFAQLTPENQNRIIAEMLKRQRNQ